MTPQNRSDTTSRGCLKCRVRIPSLNCPRCGGLTEKVAKKDIAHPRYFRNQILVPEAMVSRDLNEHVGKRKTLIRPIEEEA